MSIFENSCDRKRFRQRRGGKRPTERGTSVMGIECGPRSGVPEWKWARLGWVTANRWRGTVPKPIWEVFRQGRRTRQSTGQALAGLKPMASRSDRKPPEAAKIPANPVAAVPEHFMRNPVADSASGKQKLFPCGSAGLFHREGKGWQPPEVPAGSSPLRTEWAAVKRQKSLGDSIYPETGTLFQRGSETGDLGVIVRV